MSTENASREEEWKPDGEAPLEVIDGGCTGAGAGGGPAGKPESAPRAAASAERLTFVDGPLAPDVARDWPRPAGDGGEMVTVVDDRVGPLKKLSRTHYLQLIMPLHVELLRLQSNAKERGLRVVVLFDGLDGSGRGRVRKQFTEHMNPRGCRVVALRERSKGERDQWHFQRYIRHLPTAGEIVVFDRSWYDRALRRRLTGGCSRRQAREILRSAPEFERMLVRSGIILVKYFFSTSKKVRKRRMKRRRKNPLENWKVGSLDLDPQWKWSDYKRVRKDLFKQTSVPRARWTGVDSDQLRRAKLNVIRHFLGCVDYPKRLPDMIRPDPRIVRIIAAPGERVHSS